MIKVFCDVCGSEINDKNKCSISSPHDMHCYNANAEGDTYEIKIHIGGKCGCKDSRRWNKELP